MKQTIQKTMAVMLAVLLTASTFLFTDLSAVFQTARAADPTLTSISLNESNVALTVGETLQLTVVAFYDDNSHKTLTTNVRWSSDNTSCVSVSSAGLVTAIKQSGVPVMIYAMYTENGKTCSAQCSVTVDGTVKVDSIQWNWSTPALIVGMNYSFAYARNLYTILPADADVNTATLSCEPASALRIDNDKKIFRVNDISTDSLDVVLTLTADGAGENCAPAVKQITIYNDVPIAGAEWNFTNGITNILYYYYERSSGSSTENVATYYFMPTRFGNQSANYKYVFTSTDSSATLPQDWVLSMCDVTFSSSDERVIVLDQTTGRIIPVGNGQTELTLTVVTPKGKTVQNSVPVIAHVQYSPYTAVTSSVKIGYDRNETDSDASYDAVENTISLAYAHHAKLLAQLENDAPLYTEPISVLLNDGRVLRTSEGITYCWTSSDERVAVVDEDGIVTVTGPGLAIITLTINDNGVEFVRQIQIQGGENPVANLDWQFDEQTGTLTISGTGAVPRYDWDGHRGEIKRVVIENGVTAIGERAFSDCKTITEVILPQSLTEIGAYAFESCSSLSQVVLPENVKTIGLCAFELCGLTSVHIPRSVETIGDIAFFCAIEGNGFVDLTLKNITVDPNNPYFTAVDNVLYTKDMKELLQYPPGKPDKTFSIPDGVEVVHEAAFWGSFNLEQLFFPASARQVGEYYSYYFYAADWTQRTAYVHNNEPWTRFFENESRPPCCAKITAISIRTLPEKTTYILSEKLDLTGLVVDAVYDNGETLTLPYNVIANVKTFDRIGTQTVTVSYGGCSTTFDVTVVPIPEGSPAISVSDTAVGCTPGKLVKVTVDLRNNPGIIAARLHIGYDPQQLRLVSADNGNVFANDTATFGNDLSAVPYTVLWSDDYAAVDNVANGTLVTLMFEVAETAMIGKTDVTVTLDAGSTFNTAMQRVNLFTQNGAVSIVDYTPADANGDGEINLMDSVLISRYLAGGWNVTIIDTNADVNGDGELDLKDVVLIRRFLAGGWNVTLI